MLQRPVKNTHDVKTVTRLPQDPGPAGWDAILPARREFPTLDQTIDVDWLVIGSGFAGLAAARRLSQHETPSRIALIEARKIAEGPVGRNTGFMIDLPHHLASSDYAGAVDADREKTEMNRAAIEFAAQAVRDFGLEPHAFQRIGKINAAATEKGTRHNLAYADHLEKLGEQHTLLDAAQMQDICGSQYYQSGLFTPGTVLLQPALYARGIASGLERAGVRLFESSPVTSLRSTADAPWEAVTPQGRVRAASVILCVNGHAESFGFFRQRLMHIYLYASMTSPLSNEQMARLGGQSDWGFTPADPMGTTVRRISGSDGDRIVVRNSFTWSPNRNVDEKKLHTISKVHDRSFANRFPNLNDVGMEHRWGGLLCLSRNGSPAFGEIEPRLYAACCQNGLGAASGTLHGMLGADLALGRNSAMLKQTLTMPEPQKLPPEPFASMGANAFMHWAEFMAGREL